MCYCIGIMITDREYLRIGCKTNKSSVLTIDWLKILSMHDIIKILVSTTYLKYSIKDLSLGNQYTVDIIIT